MRGRNSWEGTASVTYNSVESAQAAVNGMNNRVLGRQPIHVNMTSIRGSGGGGGGRSGPSKSLFSLYKAIIRPSH
jgi:RNA recognition motif. (a.k.a. RRM, RBD, or RNP domain)